MTNEKLKQWRLDLVVTPSQMAAYLGVDVSTYSRWESGERQWPKIAGRLMSVLRMIEVLHPKLAKSLLKGNKENG